MSILRIGYALLVVASACASNTPSSSTPSPAAGPGSQSPQPKRQRDVVTRDEIINSPQRDPVASQNQFGPQASGGALMIKLHTEMDPH